MLVGLGIWVGYGGAEHLIELRLLELGRRKEVRLEQLQGCGPLTGIVVQQPADDSCLAHGKEAIVISSRYLQLALVGIWSSTGGLHTQLVHIQFTVTSLILFQMTCSLVHIYFI